MNGAVKTLILTGYGINCDYETAEAFRVAGSEVDRVHLADIAAGQYKLADYQILAIPGGFSFGDDLGSGKVLAAQIKHHIGEQLPEFVADGKLVIGICNGFQVLVNLGLLPGSGKPWQRQAALTFNNSARFEDRWCNLDLPASACVWAEGVEQLYLPVRHGEGRLVVDDETLNGLRGAGQIALRYAGSEYPVNPNGSIDDIAGICDPTGRILGLMPHPEAAINPTNHPRWTRGDIAPGDPLQLFKNAIVIAANI